MKLRNLLALVLGLLLALTPLSATLAAGKDTTSPVTIDIDENTPAEQRTKERNVGNITVMDSHNASAAQVSVNAEGQGTLRAKDVTAVYTGEGGDITGVQVIAAAPGAQARAEAGDIAATSEYKATGASLEAADGGTAAVTAETVTAKAGSMGGTGIDVYAKNGGRATVSITAEPGIQASSKGAYLVAKGEAARVQADVAGDIAVQNSSDNYSAGAEIFAIQGGEAELKCGGDLSIQSTRAEGVALQSWEGRAAASIEGNLLAIGQANRNGVTAIYISTVDGVVEANVGGFVRSVDEKPQFAKYKDCIGVSVKATEINQDAVVMVNVQDGVYAEGEFGDTHSVALQVDTQGGAEVTVVSGGDLYGEDTGLSVITDGLAESIDVLVNGTVFGKARTIQLFGAGTEDAVNLTAWAVKGDIQNMDGGDAEAFAKKIRYILKADPIPGGDVVLDGATKYKGFDVATAGTTVTVLPTLAEGCILLGVSNNGTALAKDGAGNFFLVVPQGGGVYLTFDVEGAVAGYPPIPVRCLGKVTSDDAALKFYDCGTFEIIRNGQGTVGFYGFEDGHLALRCVVPVSLAENADGSATVTLGELSFPVDAAVIENLK